MRVKKGQRFFQRTTALLPRSARRTAAFLTCLTFLSVLLVATALAQVQHHPLSEMFPVDQDLNLGAYSLNATDINATGDICITGGNCLSTAGMGNYIDGNLFVNGNLTVNGTLNVTNITLWNNCANGQVLKWIDGVGQCGSDDTGAGGTVTGSGATGYLAVWTGATSLSYDTNFFWDTTNDRVGIGTASPSSDLEVNGDVELTNLYDNDGAGSFFDNTCSNTQSVQSIDSQGDLQCQAINFPAETQDLQDVTDIAATTTHAVTIDSNGDEDTTIGGGLAVDGTTFNVDEDNNRVGIRTASPLSALAVGGQGLPSYMVYAEYDSNNYGILGRSTDGVVGVGVETGGYFSNHDSTGTNIGVRGVADGSSGTGTHYGGRFEASGGSFNVGVLGNADGYSGQFVNGLVRVGDAGSIGYADGDGDVYIEDELEVDGNAVVANLLDSDGTDFFDGTCSNIQSVQSIDNQGDLTCQAISFPTEKQNLQQVTTQGATTTDAVTIDSDGNEDTTIGGGLAVDTNTLVVDRTNDRVGIGTSGPTEVLTVNGAARFATPNDLDEGILINGLGDDNSGGGRIFFQENDTGTYGVSVVYNGNNSGNILGVPEDTFAIVTHDNSVSGFNAFSIARATGSAGIATDKPFAADLEIRDTGDSGSEADIMLATPISGSSAIEFSTFTTQEDPTPDTYSSHMSIMYDDANTRMGIWDLSGTPTERWTFERDSGNMGIGTNLPESNLHISNISDTMLIVEADSDNDNVDENENPRVEIRQDGGVTVGAFGLEGDAGNLYTDSQANALYLMLENDGYFHFGQNGQIAMTIDNNAEVGIGTVQARAMLHVQQTDLSIDSGEPTETEILVEATNAVLGLYSDDGATWGSAISLVEMTDAGAVMDNWGIARETTGGSGSSKLRFTYGPSADYGVNPTRVTFDPGGNVGIGTNAASSRLTINGGLCIDNDNVCDTSAGAGDVKIVDGGVCIDNDGSCTPPTDGYLIADRIGVGITSNPSYILDVHASAQPTYVANFEHDAGVTGGSGIRIRSGSNDSTENNIVMRMEDGDGTHQGDIWFSGGTVYYGPFTGAHDASIPVEHNEEGLPYGTVMCLVSSKYNPDRPRQADYYVKPCTGAADKSVMGVYAGKHDDAESGNQHAINALGDGHILVTEDGGDIEIGDYLTSSITKGHAIKQHDDLVHSYTVAKATEPVDWSEVPLDAEKGFRSKLISCTYHSG